MHSTFNRLCKFKSCCTVIILRRIKYGWDKFSNVQLRSWFLAQTRYKSILFSFSTSFILFTFILTNIKSYSSNLSYNHAQFLWTTYKFNHFYRVHWLSDLCLHWMHFLCKLVLWQFPRGLIDFPILACIFDNYMHNILRPLNNYLTYSTYHLKLILSFFLSLTIVYIECPRRVREILKNVFS